MGKQARKKGQRINPGDYGIDLEAIVDEIADHLVEWTHAEIGKRASMNRVAVSNILNGHVVPGLGATAALAKATGGKLVVKFEPPKKRK